MITEWLDKNIDSIDKIEFNSFPKISDREAWDNIPQVIKDNYLKNADEYKGFAWPALKASFYRDFFITGDRTTYQNPQYERRKIMQTLVIAQCILGEQDHTYYDDILNGIIAICEESYWGVSAHFWLPPNKKYSALHIQNRMYPIVDLFAAETGNLLAWTEYLLEDYYGDLSEELWERVNYEIKDRLLDNVYKEDNYNWMGLDGRSVNNWNPWILSNISACLILTESDTDYIKEYLKKIARCLDRYIDSIPNDGGCDEGAGYWFAGGGALFQALYMWYHATNGKINLFNEEKIKRIGSYISGVHIDKEFFVNFADSSHIVEDDGFFIALYGKYIDDNDLLSVGTALMERKASTGDKRSASIVREKFTLSGILEMLFENLPDMGDKVTHSLYRFFPDLQVAVMRSFTDSSNELTVAVKGGHNGESHNHNDIGSFIVYSDGLPVLIDAGVETYTAKTFSPQRYELWTMQSDWHNTLKINGTQQYDGITRRAENSKFKSDDQISSFEFDFDKAYPEKAEIKNLHRKFTLNRTKKAFSVNSNISFVKPVNTVEEHFISIVEPKIVDNKIIFKTEKGSGIGFNFNADVYTVELEEKNIDDPKLNSEWGNKIYRIILSAEATDNYSSEIRIEYMA